MSTWNVVLGSDSTTTPSTSIMSDFAKFLSLLVLITADICGDGFTKLTICDFFAASDLFSDGAVTFAHELHMACPLALGRLQTPALPIRQQEEVLLRRKYEEVASRIPAGD